MKIGLYGGTFDPIHNAHLIIAQIILEELELDKVIFIPSANPPHKEVFSPAKLRLQMVQSSVAQNPNFDCNSHEIDKGGTGYSINTIHFFKRRLQLDKEDLFWIMGSDNFLTFDKWRAPEEICQHCQIAVFPRNLTDYDETPDTFKGCAYYLENAPIIQVSSTMIRYYVAHGRAIEYLVPDSVLQVISRHNLYVQVKKKQ